jgi:hypothetical protein
LEGHVDEDGNPITGHRSYDGTWFDPIKKFPAVLWDGPYYGCIRVETEDDLKKYREHGLNSDHPCGKITAPKGKGISTMPDYQLVSAADLGLGDGDKPTGRQRRRRRKYDDLIASVEL